MTLVQKNNSYSASFEHSNIQVTPTDTFEPVDSRRYVVYQIWPRIRLVMGGICLLFMFANSQIIHPAQFVVNEYAEVTRLLWIVFLLSISLTLLNKENQYELILKWRYNTSQGYNKHVIDLIWVSGPRSMACSSQPTASGCLTVDLGPLTHIRSITVKYSTRNYTPGQEPIKYPICSTFSTGS